MKYCKISLYTEFITYITYVNHFIFLTFGLGTVPSLKPKK